METIGPSGPRAGTSDHRHGRLGRALAAALLAAATHAPALAQGDQPAADPPVLPPIEPSDPPPAEPAAGDAETAPDLPQSLDGGELPEPTAQPPEPPDPAAPEDLLSATDPAEARRAATLILDAAREAPLPADSRNVLIAALRAGGAPTEGLVAAIASRPLAPAGLWPYLHALIDQAPQDQLPALLNAAASFRTPAAAFILVEHLDPSRPQTVRTAAAEALSRLSGRSDLGDDPHAWRTWLATGLTLSEQGWNRRLIEGLAARLASLQQDSRLASRRLVSTYRQLWLRTPPEAKDTFLTDLLRDELAPLRQLGLELVRQELAAANPLGVQILDAANDLLQSDSPRRRLDGATLLDQVAPREGGELVVAALEREEDPTVAARLLEASARWPSLAVRDHALRWLERSPRTAHAAAEALLAIQREGLLTDPEDRRRIVESLRFVAPEHVNGAAARLLVELGEPADFERVAAYLHAEDPALRLSAANALATLPESFDRLREAAEHDETLFPALLRAVRRHRLTPEGVAALATVASVDPRARQQAQLELATELPTEQLHALAGIQDDPVFAEAILAIAERPGRRPAADAHPRDIRAWRSALLTLASARLARGEHEPALNTLDALATGPRPADADQQEQQVADLRTRALLALDRIQDAAAAGGSPEVWLAHLEERRRAGRQGEAALAALHQLYGDDLTAEQRRRLEALGPTTSVTDAEAGPDGG